jgi:hypothetical protein
MKQTILLRQISKITLATLYITAFAATSLNKNIIDEI